MRETRYIQLERQIDREEEDTYEPMPQYRGAPSQLPTALSQETRNALAAPILMPARWCLQLCRPILTTSELLPRLVCALEQSNLTSSWYTLVPSRIGVYWFVDQAAEAAVRALEQARRGLDARTPVSTKYYVQAVSSLQEALASPASVQPDAVVLAVALMSLFELTAGGVSSSTALISHAKGLTAFLLAQTFDVIARSEVIRAVLYHSAHLTFQIPFAQGRCSPFDHPGWLQLDPFCQHVCIGDVLRLLKIGFQLMVRLPRLIHLLRHVRWDPFQRHHELQTAKLIACELLDSCDKDAESTILHRVSIRETTDQENCRIYRVSMVFRTMADYEALRTYWHFRLTLLRICRQICILSCNDWLDKEWLEGEIARTVMNILMSLEFSWEHDYTHAPWTAASLLRIWGVVAEVPGRLSIPAKKLQAWILKNLHGTALGLPELDESGLYMNANMLVGGPLTNMYISNDFQSLSGT